MVQEGVVFHGKDVCLTVGGLYFPENRGTLFFGSLLKTQRSYLNRQTALDKKHVFKKRQPKPRRAIKF